MAETGKSMRVRHVFPPRGQGEDPDEVYEAMADILYQAFLAFELGASGLPAQGRGDESCVLPRC